MRFKMAFVPNTEVHENWSQEIIGSNGKWVPQHELWKSICNLWHVQLAKHFLKLKKTEEKKRGQKAQTLPNTFRTKK